MTSDRREHPCRTVDMSADIIAVHADYAPPIGERVVMYLDEWGRYEGDVIRTFKGGFTLSFEASDRKRAQVVMRLAWLSRHHLLDGSAVRRFERIVPKRPFTTFTVGEVTMPCEIHNLSRKGAALKSGVKVQNGARLTIGDSVRAQVVRQTEDGFAVQFLRLLPLDRFDEDIEL